MSAGDVTVMSRADIALVALSEPPTYGLDQTAACDGQTHLTATGTSYPESPQTDQCNKVARCLLELKSLLPQTSTRNNDDPVELLENTVEYVKTAHASLLGMPPYYPDAGAAFDAEGVCHSRVPDMQGAVMYPTLPGTHHAAASVILAGFHDCSQEVIRYLLEVEKLHDSDPLVLGLQEYLKDKERLLGLNDDGCEVCDSVPVDERLHRLTVMDSVTAETIYHQQSQNGYMKLPYGHNCYPTSACSPSIGLLSGDQSQTVPLLDNQSVSVHGLQTVHLHNPITTTTSEVQAKNNEHLCYPFSLVSDHMKDSTNHIMEDQSYLVSESGSGFSLLKLAENNPDIARLTEEILSLLDDDDMLTDYEDDDDDDISSDEDVEQ